MGRDGDVHALVHVALVLGAQRAGVVLGVAEHEEVAAVGALGDVDAGLVGLRDDLQTRVRFDVLGVHGGVAGVRCPEAVVESAHQRAGGLQHVVVEHAGELLRQLVLLDAVVVEDAGLRAPADVQRGVHVGGGPLHDAAQLVPVVDVLELVQLDGRAGDDHAVVAVIFDLVERAIERLQVLLGDVARLMRDGVQQLHLDLQRGVGQLAHDLSLGLDLLRHEVEQQHAQRADVLMHGSMLGHDEDVLAFQLLGRGQLVGDPDWHGSVLSGLSVPRAGGTGMCGCAAELAPFTC